MSRKKVSTVNQAKKIHDTFVTSEVPTLAGLIRLCKFTTYNQLYNYMSRKDEIGELFKDMYLYMVQFHEERLCQKSANVNSIFMLKCLRKLGVKYSEYAPYEGTEESKDNKNKLEITVVTKEQKEKKKTEKELLQEEIDDLVGEE